MDLRALRYFVEVVRCNSFTRAAEALHVTQPTISKMVRALEEELGGPLLLREGRGVQLTDAGQVVHARGLQVLEQSRQLLQEVAEVDGIARGSLSVGIMPTAGHYMAPVIARFQQLHPGVELHVQEQGARAQRQLLLDGKEAAFAKAIKAGAPKNAVVDGTPLLVHAAKARLGKAVSALLDANVDLIACLAWVDEVAEVVQSYGGKNTPALLRTLVQAPQADPVALWRSECVLRALCEHPELLALLASREGVDVNAQIRWALHPEQVRGSLLFNSVSFFKDRLDVLAVLETLGARSVAPPAMSDQRRLERLYWQERDAGTVAELVAAGVNLDTPLWDDRPTSLLRNVMRHPTMGCQPLTLANELLTNGASAAFWMEPDAFQREVLVGIFDAKERALMADVPLNGDRHFVPARDGQLILDFLAGLLAQGLDANMPVRLCLHKLTGSGIDADFRYKRLYWRGSLLGAVALLLCGRGSEMRPICLPLAALLLSYGAAPDDAGDLVDSTKGEIYWDILLRGDWSREAWDSHPPTGTVVERLRHRQNQVPDEVDAELIAILEKRGR